MKTYYADTRPNGKPVEAGTLCYVTDMEDGTNPIYTYGKTSEEIMEKLGLTALHNRSAFQRAATQQPTQQTTTTNVTPIRKRLSADETAQAVLDIQTNPAKAGEAVVKLFTDATGFDPKKVALDNFQNLCEEWGNETPDFYQHAGNQRLLGQRIGVKTRGDLSIVTKQMLTETFRELEGEGILFEGSNEPTQQQQPTQSTTFPGVSQVQRTERPRGSRFAGSTRSTQFAAPQVRTPKNPKYTEAQFRGMSSDRSRQLIMAGDKDYEEAIQAYGTDAVSA